jgi:ribosomal protein S3
MSSFAHSRFLNFFIFLWRAVLTDIGSHYGVVGCRIDVVGKISVAGNARSRTMLFKHGQTGLANSNIKVATDFYLVRTHTGCLGLTIWLFYV